MAAVCRRISSLRSSMVRGLFVYTFPFSRSHRKKSGGVTSGHLVGQSPKILSISPHDFIWCMTSFSKSSLPCSHTVVTGSGTHLAFCPIGTRGCICGGKGPKREADHSPSCSAGYKTAWRCSSTPPYVFMMGCWIKHRAWRWLSSGLLRRVVW
jgi:hypothetical protein